MSGGRIDQIAETLVLGPMFLSEQGAHFIKSYEGLRLKGYALRNQDLIGYGHAMSRGDPTEITVGQADAYFAKDVRHITDIVNALNLTLTQYQFDALVSLAYTLRPSTFLHSPIVEYIKHDDIESALLAWQSYNAPLPGLLMRRGAEVRMYLDGIYDYHR